MRSLKRMSGMGRTALGGLALLIVALGIVVVTTQNKSTTYEAHASPRGNRDTVVPPLPGSHGSGKTDPGLGRSVLDLFDAKQPLFIVGDKADSPAAAATAAKSVVIVPADDSGLGTAEVWVNSGSGEIGIRYSGDVVILQTPWPSGNKVQEGANPYEPQAKSLGAGSTETIGGHPAFVLEKNSRKGIDGPEPPVNSVQVYMDGFDVTLLSPSASIGELRKLAASLDEVTAGTLPG